MESGDGALCAPSPGPVAPDRSRTVERGLVHRTSVAEVLLTDVRERDGGRFDAAACWPRSHPTFPRGRDDRHSPLVLVETVRQLGILIPLRHYGVRAGAHFLIRDVSYAIDPLAEPRAGYGASEVACAVRLVEVRPGPDGAPERFRMRVRFSTADGRAFARAEGRARVLPAAEYADLRRGSAVPQSAAPAADLVRPAPGALGVTGACDVVIGARGATVVVDPVDPRHPFLFDHEVDHLPGMALLEAARQAVAAQSGGRLLRPLAGQLKALRFTEHAPPARIDCAVHSGSGFFRFRQGGAVTALGMLRYG